MFASNQSNVEENMKSCITCGMPFTGSHEGDIGLETAQGPVCRFDIENGVIKAPEQIFEGGVEFFAQSVADGDRELAARLTRTNMKSLPYWQAHPFPGLEGPEATQEEFGVAMARLSADK